ncbi:MAG: hypothetical protein ABI813_04175, partial [Bacteroidota bacterium]
YNTDTVWQAVYLLHAHHLWQVIEFRCGRGYLLAGKPLGIGVFIIDPDLKNQLFRFLQGVFP